jgi:hypothetical protein
MSETIRNEPPDGRDLPPALAVIKFVERVPRWAGILLAYAAAAFAYAYAAVSGYRTAAQSMPAVLQSLSVYVLPSGFWVYLFGGIMPMLLAEAIFFFSLRGMRPRFMLNTGNVSKLFHILLIPAFLVLGAVRISYFYVPLGMATVEAVLPLLVFLGVGVALFMLIRRGVPPHTWGNLLFSALRPLLLLWGLKALFTLVTGSIL